LDFGYHDTEEQLGFRAEVTSWLTEHVPSSLRSIGDDQCLDAHFWHDCQSLRRQLASKGWLAASKPIELGGGLTEEQEAVVWEEYQRLGILAYLSADIDPILRMFERWGTESQLRDVGPDVARGRKITWCMAGDYNGKLDTDSIGIHAFDDGDEFVLTGEAVFHGIGTTPDYLWTLALLNPSEDPYQGTACFLVPAGLANIATWDIRRLGSSPEHQVCFESVRVPRYWLLGEAGDGWSLMELAFSGRAHSVHAVFDDSAVDKLLAYADETTRDGVRLSEHPVYQQLLMEAYTIRHTIQLLRTRNVWLLSSGAATSYEPAQVRLFERQAALRLSDIVRETMGMYALLDIQDPRAPNQGQSEILLRKTLSQLDSERTMAAHREEIAYELGLGNPSEPLSSSPAPDIASDALA